MKATRLLIIASLAVILALLPTAGLAYAQGPARFLSPSGKHQVSFTKPKQITFTESQKMVDNDNIDYIRYNVLFYKAGKMKPVAEYEFRDVYGWRDKGPTPLANLFKTIDWSPNEDFAILGEEPSAGAPSTPARAVVALNRSLKWKAAWFIMDNSVWFDSLRAIGDRHGDCDYKVELFDGAKGKMISVRKGRPPVGFEIIDRGQTKNGRHVGGDIIIAKTLDNCMRCEDSMRFVPECFVFDPKSLTARLAP